MAGISYAQTTEDIVLTWTPNTEVDLANYKVYQSTTSGTYGAPIATLDVRVLGRQLNTYTVKLPKPVVDTTYFYVITAGDVAGNNSERSNELSKIVKGVPVVPPIVVLGIPTNVKSVVLNGKTTITWNAVTNANGYLLRIHKKDTPYEPCTSMSVCTGLITGLSYEVTLEAGEYDAWIHAAKSTTVFGESQGFVFTVGPIVDVPPDSPKGLVISKSTVDQVIVISKLADCRDTVVSANGSTVDTRQFNITCVK